MLLSIYNQYRPQTDKLVIFDNHDAAYDPMIYTKSMGMDIDVIFKRTYPVEADYGPKVIPYPYIMCTSNDPIMLLCGDTTRISSRNSASKLCWSGSVFKHDEVIQGIVEEHCNRTKWIDYANRYLGDRFSCLNVPYEKFTSTLSEHKVCLDLRGASRLNKRFFEILAAGSLIFAEKYTVKWGFDDGDSFCEECWFSDEQDFAFKIDLLLNNQEVYQKCLTNQEYIRNKYFNPIWLWNYIKRHVYDD
jgi:hypothetical protein